MPTVMCRALPRLPGAGPPARSFGLKMQGPDVCGAFYYIRSLDKSCLPTTEGVGSEFDASTAVRFAPSRGSDDALDAPTHWR